MFQLSIVDRSSAQNAHTYICMYDHDDVMISPPIEVFVVFIFPIATLSAKLQNFAPCENFQLYGMSSRLKYQDEKLIYMFISILTV